MKHIVHLFILSFAAGMTACSQQPEQKADHVQTIAGGAAAQDTARNRLLHHRKATSLWPSVISKNAGSAGLHRAAGAVLRRMDG